LDSYTLYRDIIFYLKFRIFRLLQRLGDVGKLAPTGEVIPFYVGYFHLAYRALAKWYLNGWRDQIFCEGLPFRF